MASELHLRSFAALFASSVQYGKILPNLVTVAGCDEMGKYFK